MGPRTDTHRTPRRIHELSRDSPIEPNSPDEPLSSLYQLPNVRLGGWYMAVIKPAGTR